MVRTGTDSVCSWIYNTAVPGNEQDSHTLYDPSKSKTYTAANDMSFSLSYGDNTSLSGSVAKERVQIGGLIVDGQTIELPDSVSSGISNDSSDGIIGLGFQSLNSIKPSPQPTWFENVMWELVDPLFTVNLKAGKAGYYKFGKIDSTAYKDGTLWYSKVDNSTGYWGFDSSQYAVGSGSTQTNGNSNSMAIGDTGSSLLFVNPAAFDAYYANVNGKTTNTNTQMTTYPCSETLPDFHVSLGDQMATIPGFMLNYMPDSNPGPNGENSKFARGSAETRRQICYGLDMLMIVNSVRRWDPVQQRPCAPSLRRHSVSSLLRRLRLRQHANRICTTRLKPVESLHHVRISPVCIYLFTA